MTKGVKSFRLSEQAARQLAWLAARWGNSQTETITVCIDRIYREEQAMSVSDVLSGITQPDTGHPTDGATWYYHNEMTPLVDVGRVPGQPGTHVLRKPDGSLVAIGGYHLRRFDDVWQEA